MQGFFPHQEFSATPGCPVVPFWLCIPGGGTSHRLRAQSPQSQACVVTCASDQPAAAWRCPYPPPWVWLIYQSGSQNSGQQSTLLEYWFNLKGHSPGAATQKTHGAEDGGVGSRSCHGLSRPFTLPVPPCVHQPRSPWTLSFRDVLWRFHYSGVINGIIDPLVTYSYLHPLSPPWRLGLKGLTL